MEPIPIGGVVGEWRLAEAIWAILRNDPAFRQVLASKEKLQLLELSRFVAPRRAPQIRNLRGDDFEQWDRLTAALIEEEGIPLSGTTAERPAMFQGSKRR